MAGKTKKKKHSRFMDTFLRVFATPTAKIGGVLLVVVIALCVFAPLFTRYSPMTSI